MNVEDLQATNRNLNRRVQQLESEVARTDREANKLLVIRTRVLEKAEAERGRLKAAIVAHHAQKADDRCVEDDDRLYAAAGLPPCDRRVGNKIAMLVNCARFLERRCEGGGWPSYVELEAERDALLRRVKELEER